MRLLQLSRPRNIESQSPSLFLVYSLAHIVMYEWASGRALIKLYSIDACRVEMP